MVKKFVGSFTSLSEVLKVGHVLVRVELHTCMHVFVGASMCVKVSLCDLKKSNNFVILLLDVHKIPISSL